MFVGSLKDFLKFLGDAMPEMNVALRTSLQTKQPGGLRGE